MRNESVAGDGYVGFGSVGNYSDMVHASRGFDLVVFLGFEDTEYVLNCTALDVKEMWVVTESPAWANSSEDLGKWNRQGAVRIAYEDPAVFLRRWSEAVQGTTRGLDVCGSRPVAERLDVPEHSTEKTRLKQLIKAVEAYSPPGTLCIDDVCVAYRDRQAIIQRPSGNARYVSLYAGSAMGYSLGLAHGLRSAKSDAKILVFIGDGCVREVAGALPEMQADGLVVFVLHNQSLGIVQDGLEEMFADSQSKESHHALGRLRLDDLARFSGWQFLRLGGPLDQIRAIVEGERPNTSLLVDVPLAPGVKYGRNSRLARI